MRPLALRFFSRDGTSGRPENSEIVQLGTMHAARFENLGSLRIVFYSCVLDADQLAVQTAVYEIRRFGFGDEAQFFARCRCSRSEGNTRDARVPTPYRARNASDVIPLRIGSRLQFRERLARVRPDQPRGCAKIASVAVAKIAGKISWQ